MPEPKAPPGKKSGGLMSKKIAGVPVPIIAVAGGVLAFLLYRKLKGSASSSTTATTPADTSSPDTSGTSPSGSGGGGGDTSGAGPGGSNGGRSSILAQLAALTTSVNHQQQEINQQSKSKETQIKTLQNELGKTAPAAPVSSKPTAKAFTTPTQTNKGAAPVVVGKKGTGVQGSGLKNTEL